MRWSEEAEARVARRIEQLLRESTIAWQVAQTHALDALPLYSDFGSSICLRKDGTLIAVGDDMKPLDIERQWEIVAMVCGIGRYPELADLLTPRLPARPGDAVPCAPCGATGRLFKAVWCGECHGLSWRTVDGTLPR